ncbi:MAG: hypothetical protein ACRCYZ_00450, partial [Alphaproteobacteria bacterium]
VRIPESPVLPDGAVATVTGPEMLAKLLPELSITCPPSNADISTLPPTVLPAPAITSISPPAVPPCPPSRCTSPPVPETEAPPDIDDEPPVPVLSLDPAARIIGPPDKVDDDDWPAVRIIVAPNESALDPAANEMSPPEPPLGLFPDTTMIFPAVPKFESPVDTSIEPDVVPPTVAPDVDNESTPDSVFVDIPVDNDMPPPVVVTASPPVTLTLPPLTCPFPPLNNDKPPSDDVEDPAITDTLPPKPVSPCPTVREISPPLPDTADPVCIKIDPLSPSELDPVSKVRIPESPVLPDGAVATVTGPEMFAKLLPELSITCPPSNADISTLPPTVIPAPAITSI